MNTTSKNSKTTFRPVGETDQRMHGTPAVLVSGFSAGEQVVLRCQMDAAGLRSVPAVYITAESLPHSVASLAALPGETNAGDTAELPRVIVMSGLTERQLHLMMDSYREGELPRPIWASVTPVSESWPFKSLLIELLKEREAMRQATNGAESPSIEPSKDSSRPS